TEVAPSLFVVDAVALAAGEFADGHRIGVGAPLDGALAGCDEVVEPVRVRWGAALGGEHVDRVGVVLVGQTPSGPRARSAALRGVVATRTPPAGRPRTVADRIRLLRGFRHGSLRRAGPDRAAGDGRTRPHTDRGHGRPAHPAGGADLPPRGAGEHEPRDRGAAVHQPEHRRVPPSEGVPEARREVADTAREPHLVRRSDGFLWKGSVATPSVADAGI